MPSLGVPELLIILVIVITIFGAGKLPQVGSAIGQSIREFRNASKDGEAKAKDVPARAEATTKAKAEPEAPRTSAATEDAHAKAA